MATEEHKQASGRESSPLLADPGQVSAEAAARPAETGAVLSHAPAGASAEASGEPLKLGRFVILERVGEGGMGVVYSAYDPELDRRVAVKLLQPDIGASVGSGSTGGRERLVREAQALAKLAHPNIVAVHDVGILGGQVFVVMEFVVGQTLRAWSRRQTRSWREIVTMYQQAGEGLAAAHASGIVHRDFKPDNALVGADGRVRVVDFGLARRRPHGPVSTGGPAATAGTAAIAAADSPAGGDDPAGSRSLADHAMDETMPAPAAPPGGAPASAPALPRALLDQSLTADGAVMGTPAYMPLEQIEGAEAGPASDQYSFCASLYEALYGARPYPGNQLAQIRESMRAGTLREPLKGSSVPRWVFEILRRGLALEPDQRYPSMRALLDQLGRDPAAAWRRRALALALVAMGGMMVYLLAQPARRAEQVCTGAERELADIWSPAARGAMELAFLGTNKSYAPEAWARAADGLDGYARDWAEGHRSACLAHRRGAQSGAMLDRRMACLQRRQQALASAVAVLTEIDAESLGHAVDVVQNLPELSPCSDIEALAQDVPPPDSEQVAERVAEARARASRAKALEDAGRYQDALAVAKEVSATADELGYRPLLVEALLMQGRIGMSSGNPEKEALAPLSRAMLTGFAAGLDGLALEALARRIYVDGMTSTPSAELPGYMALSEALLEPVPRREFVHALLLNNMAAVHNNRGEHELALSYLERALAVRQSMGREQPLELIVILQNLARVTADEDRRIALFEQAAGEYQEALGPSHPLTLSVYLAMAAHVPDPERAHELLEPTCERYERFHPEMEFGMFECFYTLAQIDAELGRQKDAAERLTHLVQLLQTSKNPDIEVVRELARGYARFHAGEQRAAQGPWQWVIARHPAGQELPWWILQWVAEASLGMGASERMLGRPEAAAQALEAAVSLLEGNTVLDKQAPIKRWLAWARSELAQAIWEQAGRTPDEPARARMRALLGQAEAWYRKTGNAARLAELMRLQEQLGVLP